MRQRENNGAKLFLTELMISIFFFAVIAAICVQLFSEANAMSIKSQELVQAVNLTTNVAEYYTVWDWQEDNWQVVFPEGEWQGDVWQVNIDEKWEPCEGAGKYLLRMKLADDGKYREAQITVSAMATEKLIYQLTVKRVVQ